MPTICCDKAIPQRLLAIVGFRLTEGTVAWVYWSAAETNPKVNENFCYFHWGSLRYISMYDDDAYIYIHIYIYMVLFLYTTWWTLKFPGGQLWGQRIYRYATCPRHLCHLVSMLANLHRRALSCAHEDDQTCWNTLLLCMFWILYILFHFIPRESLWCIWFKDWFKDWAISIPWPTWRATLAARLVLCVTPAAVFNSLGWLPCLQRG